MMKFDKMPEIAHEVVAPEEMTGREFAALNREGIPGIIAREHDPKKQSALKRKLTILVLSSLIALGSAKEAMTQQTEGHPAASQRYEETVTQKSRWSAEALLERHQTNFEAFKKLVEQEDTEQKLAHLKNKYGGSIDNFLQMHRIERDLKFLDRVEANKNDPETFVHESFPLAMTPGSIASSAFEGRWIRKEIPHKGFSVEGLENLPGFSDQEFQELIGAKYPVGYVSGSLSGIRFNQEPNVRGDMLVLARVESFGLNRLAASDDSRAPMEIYNTPEGMTAEEFMDVFAHEIHHPNDWQNSQILTSAERVNMLSDVTGRIDARGRFRSEYVEGIDSEEATKRYLGEELPPNTTPEQFLHYIKAIEYWAEIAKAHFDNPEKFKKQHPKDAEIVEKWVKRKSSGA